MYSSSSFAFCLLEQTQVPELVIIAMMTGLPLILQVALKLKKKHHNTERINSSVTVLESTAEVINIHAILPITSVNI